MSDLTMTNSMTDKHKLRSIIRFTIHHIINYKLLFSLSVLRSVSMQLCNNIEIYKKKIKNHFLYTTL